MPIYKHVNHVFFAKWSSSMAYVLGFFAADGSMIRNTRGAHFIEFHVTDRCVLEGIRRLMESDHKIAVRVRDARWKTGYRLQIGSRQMFADLERLGFMPSKSNILRMPDVPERVFGDYVRGYFDGDGCVHFKQYKIKARKKPKWVFQVRFTSGSRPYLEVLLERLRTRGVSGGFIVKKNSGYELCFSLRDGLAIYELMYNNAGTDFVYLPRKKAIFDTARTHYGCVRV